MLPSVAASIRAAGALVAQPVVVADEHEINVLSGLRLAPRTVTSLPKTVTLMLVLLYSATVLVTPPISAISALSDAIQTATANHATPPFAAPPTLALGQAAALLATLELEQERNASLGPQPMHKIASQ